ncbi:MAG: reverse transcriptase-like protein [Nanoarchaeota archaeon]|nr:reverse transcriptase-like protein [Nanoarchaeota archaeon]
MSQITDSSVYNIYTKAKCFKNPGPGAFGIVFLDDAENNIFEYGQAVEMGTNNTIEYLALIRALELLGSRGESDVLCNVNSQVVDRQLSGKYYVNNPTLEGLVGQLREIESSFRSVRYKDVPRDNEWIERARDIARGI